MYNLSKVTQVSTVRTLFPLMPQCTFLDPLQDSQRHRFASSVPSNLHGFFAFYNPAHFSNSGVSDGRLEAFLCVR